TGNGALGAGIEHHAGQGGGGGRRAAAGRGQCEGAGYLTEAARGSREGPRQVAGVRDTDIEGEAGQSGNRELPGGGAGDRGLADGDGGAAQGLIADTVNDGTHQSQG